MFPADWLSYNRLEWRPPWFHTVDAPRNDGPSAGEVVDGVAQINDLWTMRFGPLLIRLCTRFLGGANCPVIPRPRFQLGDEVRVRPPRTVRVGTIRLVTWHFNQKRYYYKITWRGRDFKTRYDAHELAKLPNPPPIV
jgi:hypothetical protein